MTIQQIKAELGIAVLNMRNKVSKDGSIKYVRHWENATRIEVMMLATLCDELEVNKDKDNLAYEVKQETAEKTGEVYLNAYVREVQDLRAVL